MSKKAFILIVLVVLFIFEACNSSKEDELPEPPIKYEKMIQVLRDVHIAEGSMQGLVLNEKDSLAKVHYAHIFKIHGVTQEEFYESYDAFIANPLIMEQMYEAVTDSIKNKSIFEE
jgi:hypothetical protein